MDHLVGARHQLSAADPRPRWQCCAPWRASRRRITSFLHGMWPRRMTVAHCATGRRGPGGTAPRRAGLSRSSGPTRCRWRAGARCSEGVAPSHRCGARSRELAAEIDFFEANWPSDLPSGVIHADLFNDNVFFLHDKLSGLIDFYFACNDLLAYDVAICLNAWCFEIDNAFNATKARNLLQGYERVRKLSDDETQALPLLARGSALRFLLTRLYDWVHTPADALVKRQGPAGISRQAALSSQRPRPCQITACEPTRARLRRSRSSPTAPAVGIQGRAAGARSCAWATRNANCPAASRATTNNRMELMAAIAGARSAEAALPCPPLSPTAPT